MLGTPPLLSFLPTGKPRAYLCLVLMVYKALLPPHGIEENLRDKGVDLCQMGVDASMTPILLLGGVVSSGAPSHWPQQGKF